MAIKKVFNQDIARELVNSDEYIQDLVYMKDYGCFYLWSGKFPDRPEGHFVKLDSDDDDMLKIIDEFCLARGYNQNYTYSSYADIEKLVRMFTLKRVNREDDKYVAFKDALLNVETFEIEPFDKSKICTTYFPYNIEETKEDTPVFKKFLSSSLVYEDDVYKTDNDLIILAQEMMGSLMLNNLKASAAFFLYGRLASNGKSQLQKVIENVFGFDQCASLSLADLSDKFSTISLIGKRVNLAGELDEKFGNSKAFKQLVTGDRFKAEYKFGKVVFFTPRTKFIFSTNKIPTFDGFDRGVRRRLIFLPFHRTFLPTDPDIDIYLEEKLKKETAGIIGWMIEGAKRLVKNNYQFTVPKSSLKIIGKFDQEMSSAAMFVHEENWVVNDDNDAIYIPRTEFYDHYKQWSYESNKKPLSRNRFYEDLENIIKDIKVVQKYIDGRPQRCFNLCQLVDSIPDGFTEEGTEIVDGGLEQLSFGD